MNKLSVYRHQCYRELIRQYLKEAGSSFRSVASATQIHTSYFSRVMSGGAEFSAEQLFKIAKALQLQEAEIDYVLLLGEWSRTSHHGHKVFIKQRLRQLQEQHLKLTDQLQGIAHRLDQDGIEAYFGDIRLAKVHMLLTIPRFRSHPHQIARRLSMSEAELERCLVRLEQLKIIQRRKQDISKVESSVHLDEHHPISRLNHKNWRIETLHQLNTGETKPHDYHFSASFTCDEDSKGKIKELLKEALVQAQHLVAECPRPEDAYVLTIDLY